MMWQSICFTAPPIRQAGDDDRRATVLLIVLVMLTIFSAVGVAFMFYASSEANSAAAYRESVEFRGPDTDPELAFAMFMQQLIFDCKDDASGVYSALRGHSLFRNMYGLNYSGNGSNLSLTIPALPFNGTGRLHYDPTTVGTSPAPAMLSGQDEYKLVNYAWCPTDGFVRHPERLGVTIGTPPQRGGIIGNNPPYIGGFNPPYTAADLNCMLLAAVQADGTLLMPSFHRDWTGFGTLAPSNPNWYSNDPKMKYMVMRPRPADHPDVPSKGKRGFSAPTDAGGDLRNRPLLFAGSGNDSIWMYTGAPVFTLPDGRRYTMLFAPLIIDLDSKLNLNVAGNTRGLNGKHASNQGWGPWEMNLSMVLSDPTVDPVSGKPEWLNLFRGALVPGQPAKQRMIARFGTTQIPGAGSAPNPVTKQPHTYGPIDYDAVVAAGGLNTGKWTLPPAKLPYQMWPTFPNGYATTPAQWTAELSQHPAQYNPMVANAGTRIFTASELNKVYRHGDTNTDALLGDLWQLLPLNFRDVRKRNMITTLSFDRREPGLTPWLYNQPSNLYQLQGYFSSGPAVRPNALPLTSPSPGAANLGKEYGIDWRGKLPTLPGNVRLDLNRTLPQYAGGPAGIQAAQAARQAFALDIYKILIQVTGAFDVFGYTSASTQPQPGEKDALRYLAQLAVNIVDFIDTDDYSTAFNWGKQGSPDFLGLGWGTEWVFGTELPKVVINEAYCEFSNDTINDPGLKGIAPALQQATYYNVDVWAELCNPHNADPNYGGSVAQLHTTAGTPLFPIYRLLVTDPNKDMHKPDNSEGRPDGAPATGEIKNAPSVKAYVDADFSKSPTINPINGAFAAPTNQANNTGFYMVGPADLTNGNPVPFPGTSPPTATLNSRGMRYKFPIPTANPVAPPTPPTLVLQRLACPLTPPNPDPTSATYNPYITVDYFDITKTNSNATHNGNVGNAGITAPDAMTQRVSFGRLQPYAKTTINQTGSAPNQPQHTFYYHNFTATASAKGFPPNAPASGTPFSWLVHLDRSLVSPMELLQVSGYRPHELTQQFTGQMFGHQAPWFDNATRLYRFFEFVQTTPRQAGAGGARIAGKVNINTIWDQEIFAAICDANISSHFTQADVATVWTRLLQSRSPDFNSSGRPAPGANSRPFLPLSTGVAAAGDTQYPTGLGVDNTLLRGLSPNSLPNTDRLIEPANPPVTANPYQRYELLNKIYNNLTTRSNTFAVWVTVGFFEVNDVDASGRIYLGQELGRSEGKNIRHKMFAIVDRSVLDNTGIYPPNVTPFVPAIVQNVLNNVTPFNPHSAMFKDLVPYFTVVE